VKTRQCLYGNGSEALNVELCSNGTSVEREHCLENITLQAPCTLAWGEWSETSCVTTDCNLTGELVKTRECLYSDGSEASDTILCTLSNESATMRDTCTLNLSVQCTQQTSFNKTGLYIGIGVSVSLIFILSILLVLVRYYRSKKPQALLCNNANPSTSPEFATDKFGTTSSKDTNQKLDKTKVSKGNISQIALYELALTNPSISEHEPSPTVQQHRKLHANDIKFGERSKGSKSPQQCEINPQDNEPNTELNVYDAATDNDSNLFEIATRRNYEENNYSIEPSLENSTEQNRKMYNSLQPSCHVTDCTYSKLER